MSGSKSSFAARSAKYYEPISMWTMVFGIVSLCQPWIEILHRYGLTITLIGLVGFMIFSHIRPKPGNE